MFDDPDSESGANEVTPNDLSSGEAEPHSAHKVGYGSTPLHTRFQKGVSGNPYGRDKRRPTADDMLLAGADRVIKVRENGRLTKKTPEQVMYANMVRAALKPNFKAIKDLLALMDSQEKKYSWDKVGWNKSDFWKTSNRKRELEKMLTDTVEDTVPE